MAVSMSGNGTRAVINAAQLTAPAATVWTARAKVKHPRFYANAVNFVVFAGQCL
jgi:hypothetical protein